MKKILFVCLGNICRSPSAEAVMNYLIEENDLTEIIECDSAGTYGYHAGEMADRRMQKHAIKRGYDLTSISRAVIKSDFDDFDYIVAMDNSNYSNLIAMAQNNIEENKIFKMTDFCQNMNADEVVPILNNLTDSQVALLVAKMKKRSASEVMGKLAPERAAKITQWLISLETNCE